MKATANIIAWCVAIGFAFSCADGSAHSLATTALYNAACLGQAPPSNPYTQQISSPATPSPAGQGAGGAANNPYNQGPATANVVQPPADKRAASSGLLKQARQALAHGKLDRATQLSNQAKQLGLTYGPRDDSPQQVDSLIQRLNQLTADHRANPNRPEAAHQHAQFLLDQAEGLIQYNDLETATGIANLAKNLPVQYQQLERTPDQVLNRIAALRSPKGPAKASLNSPLPENGPTTNQVGQPQGNPVAQATPAPKRLPATGAGEDPRKVEAVRLVALAQSALDRGDAVQAQQLAMRAAAMGLPDTAFKAGQTPPWVVEMKAAQVLKANGQRVAQAGGQEPTAGSPNAVAQSIYQPESDQTQNVMAQAIQPTPIPPQLPPAPVDLSVPQNPKPIVPPPTGTPNPSAPADATATKAPPATAPKGVSPGERLYQQGLRALERRDRTAAMEHFKEAWKFERELDLGTRQQLQDKLSLLRATNARPLPSGPEPSPLAQEADQKQQLLRQKLFSEIANEQKASVEIAKTDPKGALDRLTQLRDRVNQSEVTGASKKQLLTLVDRSVNDLEAFIKRNRSAIELDERNTQVMNQIENERNQTYEVQNKIAELVDRFNLLVDEERYAEAEVVAKQAREIDAENPVVVNLLEKARFVRRVADSRSVQGQKEANFYETMQGVERAARPFGDDRIPLVFDDVRDWADLSDSRLKRAARGSSRVSPKDLAIRKALTQDVQVQFINTPLGEVVATLGDMAGINVHLDPEGLDAENVSSDTPINLNLAQPISVRSALNLILGHLGLSYVVEDEVLLITSKQTRESHVYFETYYVADLVIPIPNFVPSDNIGLPGAISSAFRTLGYAGSTPASSGNPLALAQNEGQGETSGTVLAQMSAAGMLNGGTRPTRSNQLGPGGLGGGAQADFDSLIELITSTIAPQSWDEVGGAGAIQGFDTNLSLVVSQTQEVHEQIADLLDQLRRLQDLQVTIEVRFITLTDDFFERIGVDFDVDIDDNSGFQPTQLASNIFDDSNPTTVVGLDPQGQITPDLDISFVQDSFGATLPAFGGFAPGAAASLGFAILSDIEVFFLLEAAHGDTRSNVLQAPKVTLFNGQSATVSDTQQRPFVVSVIPVVGDFAAAQQPVIAVLAEGTTLNVQAVASSDRRFVRLTLVPFFSRIGNVDTFTFEGSTTTDTTTSAEMTEQEQQNNIIDAVTNILTDSSTSNTTTTNNSTRANNNTRGTTVQLPQFGFTTVTTTVSVPDGGTVLLGGIKRLSEGRTERGMPLLEKIPYVNRLFKNVGIGRSSTSLMMMVTPRIIIQEEEELLQTGYNSAED